MVRGRRWRRRESAAGCGRMNQTIGGLAQVDSGGGVTSLGTTSGGRIHYDSSCNNSDWKPGYTKSVCKGQGTHPARYSTRVCGSQTYTPHKSTHTSNLRPQKEHSTCTHHTFSSTHTLYTCSSLRSTQSGCCWRWRNRPAHLHQDTAGRRARTRCAGTSACHSHCSPTARSRSKYMVFTTRKKELTESYQDYTFSHT